ncbi:unnamed protein product [Agarophyton chilense]|eukprot:gb/GEZJ01003482.1/.p1 GENE.gb/GEZJ01003482.1/~~gb/GEZJ01003482.1/.p1  ORF type:complete len:332 (-),score=35.66 gb/GEZJ01003482.1/:2451-3446(-)
MAFVAPVPVLLLPSSARLPLSHIAASHAFSATTRRRPRALPFLRCTATAAHQVSESHAPQSQHHPTPSPPTLQQVPASPLQNRITRFSRLRNRTFALLALALGAYAFTRLAHQQQWMAAVASHAASLGATRAAVLLAFVNFFTVLFCFPANMGLMVAAGALLPSLHAFLALFISKTIAAAAAFALGRTWLQARAVKFLESKPRLRRIMLESGQEGGWKFVLLMRLSPFPGFMLNYLLSVTGVSFVEYVFATMIGIAPSVFNLVLVGAAASDVGTGVVTGGASMLPLLLKGLCVGSMATAMFFVTRITRRAFKDVELESPELLQDPEGALTN